MSRHRTRKTYPRHHRRIMRGGYEPYPIDPVPGYYRYTRPYNYNVIDPPVPESRVQCQLGLAQPWGPSRSSGGSRHSRRSRGRRQYGGSVGSFLASITTPLTSTLDSVGSFVSDRVGDMKYGWDNAVTSIYGNSSPDLTGVDMKCAGTGCKVTSSLSKQLNTDATTSVGGFPDQNIPDSTARVVPAPTLSTDSLNSYATQYDLPHVAIGGCLITRRRHGKRAKRIKSRRSKATRFI